MTSTPSAIRLSIVIWAPVSFFIVGRSRKRVIPYPDRVYQPRPAAQRMPRPRGEAVQKRCPAELQRRAEGHWIPRLRENALRSGQAPSRNLVRSLIDRGHAGETVLCTHVVEKSTVSSACSGDPVS